MTKSFRIMLAVVLIAIALVGVALFASAQQPQTLGFKSATTNYRDCGMQQQIIAIVPGPIIFVYPGLQSALGISDVNPSAIISPNIPQTVFSTIMAPVGVVSLSTMPPGPYYKAPLPAILVMSLMSMYFQLIIWQERSWY